MQGSSGNCCAARVLLAYSCHVEVCYLESDVVEDLDKNVIWRVEVLSTRFSNISDESYELVKTFVRDCMASGSVSVVVAGLSLGRTRRILDLLGADDDSFEPIDDLEFEIRRVVFADLLLKLMEWMWKVFISRDGTAPKNPIADVNVITDLPFVGFAPRVQSLGEPSGDSDVAGGSRDVCLALEHRAHSAASQASVAKFIRAVPSSMWKGSCAQKQRQLLRLFKGLGCGQQRRGRRRRRCRSKAGAEHDSIDMTVASGYIADDRLAHKSPSCVSSVEMFSCHPQPEMHWIFQLRAFL